jgi:hypothetical protein
VRTVAVRAVDHVLPISSVDRAGIASSRSGMVLRLVLASLRRLALVALAGLAAIGCGEHEDPGARPDAQPDAPVMVPGFPAVLELAATQATITVPFTASASGSASPPFGNVAMTRDVGTLQLNGGTLASFVYMTVPFAGYVLYQGFAVGSERWDVFWLYCQGSGLEHIYDEGVGGPELFVRPATGSCSGTATPATVQVSLPALTIPPPAPFGGYTVTGSDILVASDGTGALTLDDRSMPLVVFGEVDCSTICGAPGWYELHTIVWDETQRRVIFVIIYLLNGTPHQVQLTYARSLPDLGDPIGTRNFPATWTATTARTPRVRSAGPPFGVPPPGLR